MCRMYVFYNFRSVCELKKNLSRVDVVPNYMLIIGRFVGLSLDDFANGCQSLERVLGIISQESSVSKAN